MTETCGAITANGPGGFKLGTVGRATPGMEVKLGEDGEVLVRGPVNTPGYYRQEEATRALIDEDGWVHTGDIGTLDDDGFFAIVDRKKELIITSAGKNIAPSNIENFLKESPIVGHAMAVGDGRPYVVAVLTLDGEIAPLVAQKMGVEFTDLADLAREAGDPGDGPGGRGRRQRAAVAARAGQGVRAAPDRVDRRVRGADADAEAQAPGREHQVQRRPGPPLQLRLDDDLDLEALGVLEVQRGVLLPARVRVAVGEQLVPAVRRRLGADPVERLAVLADHGEMVDAGAQPIVRFVDLVGRALEEEVGAVGVLERRTVAAPAELAEQPAPLAGRELGIAHPQIEVVDGAAHCSVMRQAATARTDRDP